MFEVVITYVEKFNFYAYPSTKIPLYPSSMSYIILQAAAIGALAYIATLVTYKTTRPALNLDLVEQPLDEHRVAPRYVDQPDMVQRESKETLKDKNSVQPTSTHPFDIKLDIISQSTAEFTSAPPAYLGEEGIYTSDERQYINLNLDV